jgi:hypothetical protein
MRSAEICGFACTQSVHWRHFLIEKTSRYVV